VHGAVPGRFPIRVEAFEARRFNADGLPQGAEILVDAYLVPDASTISVASDAAGDFVVSWLSPGRDGSGLGVYARRYGADGVPRDDAFRVNTYITGDQAYQSVASDPRGNFVVTWSSDGQDGSGFGVYAQRYIATAPASMLAALSRLSPPEIFGDAPVQDKQIRAASNDPLTTLLGGT
jgi:hypothetical protein